MKKVRKTTKYMHRYTNTAKFDVDKRANVVIM